MLTSKVKRGSRSGGITPGNSIHIKKRRLGRITGRQLGPPGTVRKRGLSLVVRRGALMGLEKESLGLGFKWEHLATLLSDCLM
jgi:hypothetical protein